MLSVHKHVFSTEEVCSPLREKQIVLFSDNSPTIGWVTRLASKRSLVAKHLVQTLALRLKIQRACPLTPSHIKGKRNAISDVPSRLFGSNPTWKCDTDADLLTLFNPMFPLPHQISWTVFHQLHVLWLLHRCVEVEILQVYCAVMRSFCFLYFGLGC